MVKNGSTFVDILIICPVLLQVPSQLENNNHTKPHSKSALLDALSMCVIQVIDDYDNPSTFG